MKFEEYLKGALNGTVSEHYDPSGNSDRAVVTRGLLGEIAWQYKAYPKRIMTEIDCFDGLSTELGWFIQLPIMILLAPVLPILAAKHWHKRALGEYKTSWENNPSKDF